MLNTKNIVYKADSMLCSGDIVENHIRRKEDVKEYSEEQKIQALYDFYNLFKIINITFFSRIN